MRDAQCRSVLIPADEEDEITSSWDSAQPMPSSRFISVLAAGLAVACSATATACFSAGFNAGLEHHAAARAANTAGAPIVALYEDEELEENTSYDIDGLSSSTLSPPKFSSEMSAAALQQSAGARGVLPSVRPTEAPAAEAEQPVVSMASSVQEEGALRFPASEGGQEPAAELEAEPAEEPAAEEEAPAAWPCKDGEKLFNNFCHVDCAAATQGQFPHRGDTCTCCASWPCQHLPGKYERNCIKLDKGANGLEAKGPELTDCRFENEEMFENFCYLKCSILTAGMYPTRTGMNTCSNDEYFGEWTMGVGACSGFGVGGDLCMPHIPMPEGAGVSMESQSIRSLVALHQMQQRIAGNFPASGHA